MVESLGQSPIIESPAKVLAQVVDVRHAELNSLSDFFTSSLELVMDTQRVNDIISNSLRPELVLSERVPQKQMREPYEHGFYVNNFIPKLRGFGIPIYVPYDNRGQYDPETRMIGRRQLTQDELTTWLQMGARGDFNSHHAHAQKIGVAKEDASDMLLHSLIGYESFMRLYVLAPQLTEHLIRACLDEVDVPRRPQKEEIFVAYTLMSQLVDLNDKGAVDKEGTRDDWLLCR